jgi:hypothetical protein
MFFPKHETRSSLTSSWKPSSMKVTSNGKAKWKFCQAIPTKRESTGLSSFGCCRVRQSGKCAQARTKAPLYYLNKKQRLSYKRKVQSLYGTLCKLFHFPLLALLLHASWVQMYICPKLLIFIIYIYSSCICLGPACYVQLANGALKVIML